MLPFFAGQRIVCWQQEVGAVCSEYGSKYWSVRDVCHCQRLTVQVSVNSAWCDNHVFGWYVVYEKYINTASTGMRSILVCVRPCAEVRGHCMILVSSFALGIPEISRDSFVRCMKTVCIPTI